MRTGAADTPSAGVELETELGIVRTAFHRDVVVSLGPNSEVGRDNDMACHRDIPCGAATIARRSPIVLGGRVVPPELRAPGH